MPLVIVRCFSDRKSMLISRRYHICVILTPLRYGHIYHSIDHLPHSSSRLTLPCSVDLRGMLVGWSVATLRRHAVHGDRYQWNVGGLGGFWRVLAALGNKFGDYLRCWRSVSAQIEAAALDNPPRVAQVRFPGAHGLTCVRFWSPLCRSAPKHVHIVH